MKYYLKDIIPRLKKFSASLDQSSLLIDKPWVVSKGDGKTEKLIFKQDGTLYMSSDGDVTEGKWVYLPEAFSLLIDYGDKKKLYKHQYLDEAVLALKLDNSSFDDSSYYLLSNENIVTDQDAVKYLQDKYQSKKQLNNGENKSDKDIRLTNGNIGVIEKLENESTEVLLIDGKSASDGKYLSSEEDLMIVVKDGRVQETYNKAVFEGVSIWKSRKIISEGDIVEGMDSGEMTISDGGDNYKLLIQDNEVKEIKNLTARTIMYIVAFLIVVVIIIMISHLSNGQ